MTNLLRFTLLLVTFLLLTHSTLVGQERNKGNRAPEKPTVADQARNERGIQPDQEKQVLAFVEANHSKLSSLLKYLKKKRSAEYEQVMRELTRVSQRLENLAKRDTELHAIELDLWKIRSEQRLLAAEIAAKKNANKLEEQLKTLVEKEYTRNLERLQLQRNRVEKQLAQIKTQIERQQESRSAQVEKSLKQWKNKIARQTAAKSKSNSKKAAN